MAVLTVQTAGFGGLADVNFVAAGAGGDSFVNNGQVVLIVKNGDASPKTVTINSQQLCSQGFDHDISVVVAAGDEALIGKFPTGRFNDTTGSVLITYSAVTNVTVAAVQV